MKSLATWVGIATVVGGFGTAGAVIWAKLTLDQTATDGLITNSMRILEQGMQLDRDYKEGKSGPRDIVAFYYQVDLYRRKERLLDEVSQPLSRSLCSAILHDPRVLDYWKNDSKIYFDSAFVESIEKIHREKKCDS